AMLGVEQGGMMETLADLYAITKDEKYLKLAQRFWHKAVLDPLAAGQDKLTGLHANTNIPKVIGAARLYELTGDEKYATTAKTFWNVVTEHRSFVTGSNSDREHFFDLGLEAKKLGPENGETCNVYNMLKLTAHLARWSGEAAPFDFYERAMFNHILGSIDPASGMCTYFQSLEPGRFKVYSSPENSFWCCTGTGLENHSKYALDAYTHGADDTLDVNLFIASELTWAERGLVLRQETTFPETDVTKLTLKLQKPTRLKLRVREPSWAGEHFSVSVGRSKPGSEMTNFSSADGYRVIDRTWQDGDTVTVTLPMKLTVHRAIDDPTMAAVMYGPIVLAAQLGREDFPQSDSVPNQTSFDNRPIPAVPMLVTDSKSLEWLKPIAGKPLHFSTEGVGRPSEIEFAPLYATHHQRYGVYMRLVDTTQYTALQQKLAAEAEAQRKLEARTVDQIVFGEQQPEQDHAIASKNSRTGHHGSRPWRDATSGGFFSARLALKPSAAQIIRCTYWGSDNHRTFDLLLDGKLLATQVLANAHPGDFFDVDYAVPADVLLAKKENVTLEFRPHEGSTAGGVFGCRVLLAEPGAELLNGK
ncbi:MAG: acetyl-CoA carboxylase, biotin carboxylase, partial [Phycisphaerales bacterium]|nr:acetyl-CoA carboxylase, biotin carboxylase [Phycisphaerales bacterium]